MERDQASKFVNDLLRLMVSRNGSDLFLTADFPPAIKVDGKDVALGIPEASRKAMAKNAAAIPLATLASQVATTKGLLETEISLSSFA